MCIRDRTKLIYGSADKIRSTAEKLRGFQSAFDNAGEGLRGLDSSKLKGCLLYTSRCV